MWKYADIPAEETFTSEKTHKAFSKWALNIHFFSLIQQMLTAVPADRYHKVKG